MSCNSFLTGKSALAPGADNSMQLIYKRHASLRVGAENDQERLRAMAGPGLGEQDNPVKMCVDIGAEAQGGCASDQQSERPLHLGF